MWIYGAAALAKKGADKVSCQHSSGVTNERKRGLEDTESWGGGAGGGSFKIPGAPETNCAMSSQKLFICLLRSQSKNI